MPKKTHSFNVLLDPALSAKLSELTTVTGWNKAQVTRQAIAALHAHLVLQSPTCADNRPCVAPHLIPQRPTTPLQPLIPATVHNTPPST